MTFLLTRCRWCLLAAFFLAGTSHATIYSCVDAQGRRLTSDRPLPECADREHRVLNADGSVRKILAPSMTPQEQELAQAKAQRLELEKAAQLDAIRRDRNLLSRFPNEASHQKARNAALDDIENGVKFSQVRLRQLEDERQPLIAESEFYVGKKIPLKLRQKLDANDAAAAAQRSLVQNQKYEISRIVKLYDDELVRLKKLWAGAPLGSLDASSASPAASRP